MAMINRNAIKLQIATQRGSRNVIGAILDKKAEEITEANKKKLIEAFLDDRVTEEIEEGPEASNISGTLNGKGNLFSFIGFPVNSDPIDEVVKVIQNDIKVDPNSKIQGRDSGGRFKYGGDNLLFDYRIPMEQFNKDLIEKTPLPFDETKSWLVGIEKGISGFTSYIYWKTKGRSTGGIQANDGRNKNGQFNGKGNPIQLRGGDFKPVPYFSALYAGFTKLFKGNNEI